MPKGRPQLPPNRGPKTDQKLVRGVGVFTTALKPNGLFPLLHGVVSLHAVVCLLGTHLSQAVVLCCDFPEEEVDVIPIIHCVQKVGF